MFKPFVFAAASLVLASFASAEITESSFWKSDVDAGSLPPVDQRVPAEPLVVDLEAKGRVTGKQGGTLNTMVTRTKDVRQMVVYGYARLVGYDAQYDLQPDILKAIDNEDNRKFTLHLRPGHKWSDGAPFTSEDFRYWWENVANHPELSPSGPPGFLRVQDQLPTVTFPDEHTIVYEWETQNLQFMQELAEARPPFIYRPAHYLKPFHADFTDPEELRARTRAQRLRSWAALHNKLDNMYKSDNADLPTLQPWMLATKEGKSRFLFVRNPYYHRVDTNGTQLPYVDVIEMDVVSSGLVAAKANAGEADLQARGLDFKDAAILRKGEQGGNYRTHLWGNGVASQIAIYLNLNYNDDGWREIMRDVRFRRALSMGIDRTTINKALYFGLAKEGAMTVLPLSPFFKEKNRAAWAAFDKVAANALLDELGLDKRDKDGTRILPDGRPAWVVIETAGERQEVENALQIISDNWADIGIKLVMRPLERDILRNRVYAGEAMAATWFGWDNGLAQPYTPPVFAVPMQQEFFSWPKWGQHYQTNGTAGEPPDMPTAIRLMELGEAWNLAESSTERSQIWQEIVDIHADQVFAIGILAEAPQPVVVAHNLKNVPEKSNLGMVAGGAFRRPSDGRVLFRRLGARLMAILRYAAFRTLTMLATLLVVSALIFVIINLPPGDYLSNQINELRATGQQAGVAKAEFLRKEYALDRPIWEQYLIWMGFAPGPHGFAGMLQGEFGWSFEFDRPVADIVGEAMWLTILVNVAAILFVYMIALPLGVLAAAKSKTWIDYTSAFVGYLGLATPNFLLALILFYYGHKYLNLPIGGLMAPEFEGQPMSFEKVKSILIHLIIPTFVIGTSGAAGMMQRLRANMLDELAKPYVETRAPRACLNRPC